MRAGLLLSQSGGLYNCMHTAVVGSGHGQRATSGCRQAASATRTQDVDQVMKFISHFLVALPPAQVHSPTAEFA